jgi:hypothetical protein
MALDRDLNNLIPLLVNKVIYESSRSPIRERRASHLNTKADSMTATDSGSETMPKDVIAIVSYSTRPLRHP